MSRLRLQGSTSGFVELEAPAISDDGVLVLPTAAQGFGPAGIGSNVVSVIKSDKFTSTSATFTTVTGLTATITPSSDTSKILIIAQVTYAMAAGGSGYGYFRLSGGNTAGYQGDASGSQVRAVFGGFATGNQEQATFSGILAFLDSPATTSATTYEVQARRAAAQAVNVNRSSSNINSESNVAGVSSITVIEVAA